MKNFLHNENGPSPNSYRSWTDYSIRLPDNPVSVSEYLQRCGVEHGSSKSGRVSDERLFPVRFFLLLAIVTAIRASCCQRPSASPARLPLDPGRRRHSECSGPRCRFTPLRVNLPQRRILRITYRLTHHPSAPIKNDRRHTCLLVPN